MNTKDNRKGGKDKNILNLIKLLKTKITNRNKMIE